MNPGRLFAVEWQALPELPEPMGNFACGALGRGVVLVGGISWREGSKVWRDSLWRFDIAKQRWAEAGRLPAPLAYPAFGQTREGLVYAGGSDGQATQSAVVCLNGKWKRRQVAELSQPLVYSGFTVTSGRLYVLCGARDAGSLATLTNSFYCVDLRTGRTELLPAYPTDGLMLPAAAAVGDRLFAFTGAQALPDGQVQNVDSAFVYSIASKRWTPLQPYPLKVRGLAACALDERYILLGGGFKDDFIDDQFVYDTETGRYLRAQPLPYRAMANYLKVGEELYWIGGEDRMRHRSGLFYRIGWKELLGRAVGK